LDIECLGNYCFGSYYAPNNVAVNYEINDLNPMITDEMALREPGLIADGSAKRSGMGGPAGWSVNDCCSVTR